MLAGLDGRLVAVVAGAGYGKSVLLARAVERTEMHWAWCSCDDRIETPGQLLAHVAAGLARQVPGFGAALALDDADADGAVRALSNEIVETIGDDVVLVFDDVHDLPPPSAACLGLLARDLPEHVHLAFAGRAPLPFNVAPFHTRGLVVVDERDLALDMAEAAALARSARAPLGDTELRELHRRTEGWITALILALHSGGPAASDPDRDLFDYLASQTLERMDGDLERFLLRTCVLERFTPAIAGAVSGDADAAARIERLLEEHLFTFRLDGAGGPWFRYHQLLSAFLRRRLASREPDTLVELNHRAAAAWLDGDEPLEAARHLLAIGRADEAADLLRAVAESLVHTPQASAVASLLAELPGSVRDARPGLLLAQASLLRHRAQELAYAPLERAIDRLAEAGEDTRAATAAFQLLQHMAGAGAPPSRRIDAGRRSIDLLPADLPALAGARVMVAAALGFAGRSQDADDWLAAAAEAPDPFGGLAHDAAAVRCFCLDYPRHGPDAALERLQTIIERLEGAPARELLSLVHARAFRPFLLHDAGRHQECLSEIDDLERTMREHGLHALADRAHPCWRLASLAALGRAGELDDPAPVLVEVPGELSQYTYRRRVPAAALAAHRGDLAALAGEVEGARSELAAHGLTIETPVATCDLASICVGGGAPTLARSLAEEARADAAVLGIPWSEARAALLSAAASEGGAGDPLLSAALEITEREGLDGLWTRRERDLGVPLLGRAIAKGLGPPGVAERLLGSCGPRAVARVLEGAGAGDRELRLRLAEIAGWVAGIDMELVDRLLRDRDAAVRAGARATWTRVKARPRAEISILTLGGLEVRRDGVRVPEDAFARSKARALLACLVAAGRPVHRDALCDALWPDLSPRRAGAALRTTLVDLRRAVEPEVDAGSRDALVATEGDVIRLAFSDRDFLDVAELTRLAGPARGEAVEESIRRLLRANDLVRGPFLPEWPYEDWAEATRAEVDEVALTVLEELARALASSGHPDLAIPHLRRLVALEPEREGHHRALMDAYDATGERAMALRQYHACRVVLRRELGVEPSSATRAAFLRLLGEQPLVELAV